MNLMIDVWQSFKATVRGFDSPHQLALGVTVGLMLGLIPKDSVLPYAIGLIGLLSTANLLCLGLGTGLGILLGPNLDPIAHQIGCAIWTWAPLQSVWDTIYQYPLVPWLQLNNSVVLGHAALGLLVAIPVYLLSRLIIHQFGPPIYRLATQNRWVQRWMTPANPTLQEG